MTPDYLRLILSARVYDVAIESPLEPAAALSRRLGSQVLLKREDKQPVFSFKLRGAYNKMAHLSAAELARGVICASAGNDNGHVILDVHGLKIVDPVALETELNQIPGIVTNGVFARRPADHLLLASTSGTRRLDRRR